MLTNKMTKDDLAFWIGFYDDDTNDSYDYFTWASNKAYLDMNRTLTFSKTSDNEKDSTAERAGWRDQGTAIIRNAFRHLDGDFVLWHHQVCDQLIAFYRETDSLVIRGCNTATSLTFGQAQKWLNMALKYLWLLNRAGILSDADSAIVDRYEHEFHVPLDSYILRYVAKKDKSKKCPFTLDNGLKDCFDEEWNDFGGEWSKINHPEKYYAYQQKLQKAISGSQSSLEWELYHWHKALKYYG